MKTRTKFISIILSAIMLISTAPLAMAENTVVIPENTNTVWENDFEFIEASNGALPSGTTGTAGAKEVAAIDMRAQYADYEIKADGDNQYIYFKPDQEKTANVGNIFSKGYFKINTDNVVTNGVSTNPTLLDAFKIDKLRLDVSLKLDSLMDVAICSYYSGKMNELTSAQYQILGFTNDGKVVLNPSRDGKVEIGTYEADEWINIDLYIDYTNHTAMCYIDETCKGSVSLDSKYEYFNQIRITANAAEDTEGNYYGVSVDNIRYSTTYIEDYINRNPYSSDLARLDFDNLIAGTSIALNDTNYYINSDRLSSVKVIKDSDKQSNVAEIAGSGGTGRSFGIKDETLEQYFTHKEYNKYPDLIKVEFDMKRNTNTAAWGAFGNPAVDDYLLLKVESTGVLKFNDGSKGTTAINLLDSGKTVAANTWFKVSLYFNFATGKYKAYLDDIYVAEYTIPKMITGPGTLAVGPHGASKIWVDNFSISTLPPFGSAEIVDYFDLDATLEIGDILNITPKIGYVLNNTDATNAMNYEVLCAKFNENDVLENVTITPASIAAGKMELKAYDKQTASDGGYYKYFVWDGMGTLKPLLSGKVVR